MMGENTTMISVGEVLENVGRQPKVPKSIYSRNGSLPVIDQGAEFVGGFTDDESFAYRGKLPVVIFGDHTRILKFVSFPFAVGADGTQLLRPIETWDTRYLFYALLNLRLKNYGYERHFKYLKEEKIPQRPIEQQRHIADILSAYDDLIENNTRRIQILERMAQALYREWFVHFRFPGHARVKLVASPLGKIPQGWQAGTLDDALLLQRGFDLPKQSRREGSIPIYAATGITGWHDEAKVKGPGVVTGRSGSLGTVVYIPENFWPLNTALWVKEFRRSTPLHAYFLLNSLDLASFNAGAAVPTLNRNDVSGLSVVLPPPKILGLFDEHATPLFALKRNLEMKTTNLRRTRDLLLPRLLSGKIELTEN